MWAVFQMRTRAPQTSWTVSARAQRLERAGVLPELEPDPPDVALHVRPSCWLQGWGVPGRCSAVAMWAGEKAVNLRVPSHLRENVRGSGRQKALGGHGLSEVTMPWLDGDQLSAAWPGPPPQPGPSCPLSPLPVAGDGYEQTSPHGHLPLSVGKSYWQLAGEVGEAHRG